MVIIGKYMYYGSKYAFWSAVEVILNDLFLTFMYIIVGTIIAMKIV